MPNLQIALISNDKCMFPMKRKYNSSFALNCFSIDDLVLKCFWLWLCKTFGTIKWQNGGLLLHSSISNKKTEQCYDCELQKSLKKLLNIFYQGYLKKLLRSSGEKYWIKSFCFQQIKSLFQLDYITAISVSIFQSKVLMLNLFTCDQHRNNVHFSIEASMSFFIILLGAVLK